ncbi:hypothetical protein DPMN_135954 [Dreissena polymorpha]|uniref:Uncharacterized protein n=1 Tax=Dreissena polymorpha TaxID=45954 RepID=A0A9D4FZ35_DREPO|nr:hypothetical protein DPMN_135954 [Dreissena polymorpha]
MMRQKRISEMGVGDGVLYERSLYSDVRMIHPIVTSEPSCLYMNSMKTTCDVNAAEIAKNCTSDMMIGTESALKCTTSVVEATTSTS